MPSSRHLPWHLFHENYLEPGNPALHYIEGTPEIHIAFLPKPGTLSLMTPYSGEGKLQIERKNIFCDLFDLDGQTMSRVLVRDEPLFREFYAICTEVADRCQLNTDSFNRAVVETIQAFDLLLKSAMVLPPNIEIGLTGELLILQSLLRVKGPEAIDAWRGADRDKHDFRIDNHEIEVKATTGSRRRHWINGLTQLRESENCQLDLVSIHLARTGGAGILSLKQLVQDICSLLSDSPSATERFREGLHKVVTVEQLELAESQFNLRQEVRAFNVKEQFPRLTPEALKAAIGESSIHVAELSYLLDLEEVDSPEISSLTSEILFYIGSRYA